MSGILEFLDVGDLMGNRDAVYSLSDRDTKEWISFCELWFGNCVPDFTYEWSSEFPTGLVVQIADPLSSSADVTATLDLGNSGFGLAQYELKLMVTMVCGSGECQDMCC